MDISNVAGKMIMLFSIMIIGYIAKKKNIFNEASTKTFSSLVVNITAPCLVLGSLSNTVGTGKKTDAVLLLGISFAIYFILALFSKLVAIGMRYKSEELGVVEFLTIFSNNGFMGFPVIEAIFGKEALLYSAIINLPVNILVYSYGVLLVNRGGKKEKIQWKKILNPAVYASAVTICLYLADFTFHPVVNDIFNTLGNVTTPLAMLIIGISLAGIPAMKIISDWKAYVFSLIRLMVIPFLTWVIGSRVFDDPLVSGVLVVTMGMPCATVIVMLCAEYGKDEELASKYVFVTTALSAVSIPALAYILSQLH